MTDLARLAALSRIPLSAEPVRGATYEAGWYWGTFSAYVVIGGERIWVRLYRGAIVAAEIAPLAGSPNVNRKWIAGIGRVGLEAGALIAAAKD